MDLLIALPIASILISIIALAVSHQVFSVMPKDGDAAQAEVQAEPEAPVYCITGDNVPDPDCINCGGDGILNPGEGLFESYCYCTLRVENCSEGQLISHG